MYTTIETLWNQGHNKSFISRATGHDWKTIDKVIKLLALGKDAPDRKPHPRKLSKHHDIFYTFHWLKLKPKDLLGYSIDLLGTSFWQLGMF